MLRHIFALSLVLLAILTSGCVGAHVYNPTPDKYLQQVPFDDKGGTYDLAIIEFDDRGEFWLPAQLRDAVALINERNAASKTGIMVGVYIHGWTNNADPTRESGNLQMIRRRMAEMARDHAAAGPPSPDRLVIVYIGWRGDRISIPVLQQLTFWDRKAAAKHVASLDMQETLSAIMQAGKQRNESKVFLYGHSLGGAILEQTIAGTVAGTVQGPVHDRRVPVDLIILVNPAIEALHARQLLAVLRRHEVNVVLKAADGTTYPSRGPFIVSITSEADMATKFLFPIGMHLGTQLDTYRSDNRKGEPSQAQLSRMTEGHSDYLMSHKAFVRYNELYLQEIPNRFNNTPFWIIRTTPEVCGSHSDLNNPRLQELISRLFALNQIEDTSLEAHLVWQPWSEVQRPPATQRSRLWQQMQELVPGQ